MTLPTCLRCGRAATDFHHALPKQLLRREGGDLTDGRNLFWLCRKCHGNHHSRYKTISLQELPDSVYEYAAELLGPGRAYSKLSRLYSGSDPRLEALIAPASSA